MSQNTLKAMHDAMLALVGPDASDIFALVSADTLAKSNIGTVCGDPGNAAFADPKVQKALHTYFGGVILCDLESDIRDGEKLSSITTYAVTIENMAQVLMDCGKMSTAVSQHYGDDDLDYSLDGLAGLYLAVLVEQAGGSARLDSDPEEEHTALSFESE